MAKHRMDEPGRPRVSLPLVVALVVIMLVGICALGGGAALGLRFLG